MDERTVDRIEKKIDDLSEHLGSIDKVLAAQHVTLKDHIRRTAALEKKLEPVEKHVSTIEGAVKLITLLGIVATIISTILHIYKVI